MQYTATQVIYLFELQKKLMETQISTLKQESLARISAINEESQANIKRNDTIADATIAAVKDEYSTRMENLRIEHVKAQGYGEVLHSMHCNHARDMHSLKYDTIKEQSNSQAVMRKVLHGLEVENARDEGKLKRELLNVEMEMKSVKERAGAESIILKINKVLGKEE